MQLICPGCTKMVQVPDDAAGTVRQCPLCLTLFRAPQPGPAAVPGVPASPAAPPQESPAQSQSEIYTLDEPRRPTFPVEQEMHDLARRQARLKKVRKRSRKRHQDSSAIEIDLVRYVLYAVVLIGVALFVASLFARPAAIVMLILGALMYLAGEIWCTVKSFQDGTVDGLVVLFNPYRRLAWVFTNIGFCGIGGVLLLGGLAFEIVSIFSLLIHFFRR